MKTLPAVDGARGVAEEVCLSTTVSFRQIYCSNTLTRTGHGPCWNVSRVFYFGVGTVLEWTINPPVA